MIFKFEKTFLPYTNFQKEIEVKGEATLRNAMSELFNSYPQLAIFLMDNKAEESKKSSMSLNGKYIWKAEDTDVIISDKDVLEFGRDIPSGSGAVGKIVAGVVLIVAAVVAYIIAPTNPFSLYLGSMGASLLLGGIAEAMMGTPVLDAASSGSSSPTYSFSGIQNTTAAGSSLGIVYGTHRVGGQLLNVFTDVSGTDTYLNAQIGLCEGTISDMSDVEINKNPISFYDASTYTIYKALGEENPAVMPNFNRVENTVSLGNLIPLAGSVPYRTAKEVDAITATISCPSLYYSGSNGLQDASVSFKIEYKKSTDATYTTWINTASNITDATGKITITAPYTKSELVRDYLLKFSSNGIYDVRVVRITADHSGDVNYGDTIYLKSINEIVYDKFVYPFTAMLGIRIKATEQLSGNMPVITTLVKGTKVLVPNVYHPELPSGVGVGKQYSSATWDGTWATEKQWTSNPVWCLYDLLTNTRYGLGNDFRIDDSKLGLMKAQFFIMAKYCDELVNGSPRYSLNIVLDSSRSAAEWVGTIASTMQATVFYTEGRVWLDIDRPKALSAMYNMSSIEKGSFKVNSTSYKSIPNVYEIKYPNKDKGYEADTFRVESYKIQTDAFTEEIKKSLNLLGVTDINQCKRIGKYALLAGEYNTKIVTFKTGTEGLKCLVGGVIGIQHDVPQWGFGGRVISYDPTTKLLEVSSEFIPIDGSTYEAKISHKGGVPFTVAVGTVDPYLPDYAYVVGDVVSNDKVTYRCIKDHISGTDNEPGNSPDWDEYWVDCNYIKLSAAPSTVPTEGDKYIVGETSNSVALYKVVSIKRDPDEKVELSCISYNEQIYIEADNIDDISTIDLPIYTQLSDPTKVSVSGVYAEERLVQSKNGSISTAIDVYFSDQLSNSFWKNASIYYRISGASTVWRLAGDSSDTFTIYNVQEPMAGEPPISYDIVVVSNYKNGSSQSISEAMALAYPPFYTLNVYGKTKPPADVQNFSAVCDSPTGNIILTWDKVADLDLNGYEISKYTGGTYEVVDKLFKGQYYSLPPAEAGTYRWAIRSVDTSGNYSGYILSNELNIGIPSVVGLSYIISGDSVIFKWTAATSTLPIDSYLFYVDGAVTTVRGLTHSTKITWAGDKVFSVRAVDIAGNIGDSVSQTVKVDAAASPDISYNIAGEYVVISWSNTRGTLPISYYLITSDGTVGSEVTETMLSSTYSCRVNWHGSKAFSVTAVDSAGNISNASTVSINVIAPTVSSASYSFIGDSVVISWEVAAGPLPIKSYGLASDAAGNSAAVDRVLTTKSYTQKVDWLGDRDFSISVVDSTGVESAAMSLTVGIVPPSVVRDVLPQVIDNNVLLKWTPPESGSLPIAYYEIRKGATYVLSEVIGTLSGTFNVIFESQAGTYLYWITTVDSAGNKGPSYSQSVFVNQPPDYVLYDNRQLYWDGVKESLLAYTPTYAYVWDFVNSSEGWVVDNTTITLGSDELTLAATAANPSFSMTGLSFAGKDYPMVRARIKRTGGTGWEGNCYYLRDGIPWSASYRKQIAAPTDLVDYQWVEFNMHDLTYGGDDWKNSTITGIRLDFGVGAGDTFVVDRVEIVKNEAALPNVNLTDTFDTHFTSNSWTTPQAQVTAGYSYFIQPMETSGSYSETIDYGVVIGGTKVVLDLQTSTVTGSVTITPSISVKLNAGDAWTVYSDTYQVFATNFRYVKIDLVFSSDDKGIISINSAYLRLDMKMKTLAGSLAIPDLTAAGATVSLLDNSGDPVFVDVTSVAVSANTTGTSVFAVYDFVDVANPTSFKIYLFDANGTRVTGTASWTVRGV